MVGQLATAAGFTGHTHASQLGWGTSLNQHRTIDVPGFAVGSCDGTVQSTQIAKRLEVNRTSLEGITSAR